MIGAGDSGNPCRNDERGAGRLYHLEFTYYPKNKFSKVVEEARHNGPQIVKV